MGSAGKFLRMALALLAMALPFAVPGIALLILLVAVGVVMVRWKHGGGSWRTPTWRSAMPWMALFYLLHGAGMAWTSNTQHGLFDLQVKASFLLFPLLLWLLPVGAAVDVGGTLRAFSWSSAVSALVCLVASIWRFAAEWLLRSEGLLPEDPAWTNHFFESRFSLFLHPSYMAMHLCFALVAWNYTERDGIRSVWATWLTPALLVLGVILCNSKMGWLTLALVLGHALLSAWKDSASRRQLVALVATGLLVFGALFCAFPTVSDKLTQAINATGAIDPSSDQSSALRRMAWDAATDLFFAHPMVGVGTGDIKDELIAIYRAEGYLHAEAKRMNAHSQFLQSAAALGVPGLFALLAMVLLPTIAAWRSRDRPASLFWLIILLNWGVESMAEVQAGVVFAALVALLLEAQRHPLTR